MEVWFAEMGKTVGGTVWEGEWEFGIGRVRSNVLISIQKKTSSRQLLIGLWDSVKRPGSSQTREGYWHLDRQVIPEQRVSAAGCGSTKEGPRLVVLGSTME